MSETTKWTARPSFRPLILAGVISGGIGAILLNQISPLFQSVINATHEQIYWSDAMISKIYNGLKFAVFIPLAIVIWKMLVNLTIRYEVSEGRFLYHHGIIFRRHDQIMLQRVRDFRVYRPLVHMMLGVGKVHIVSRDETFPELTVGPFAKPLEVEKMLHEAVKDQQGTTGFREFETY